MPLLADRPISGLSPAQALERWSDPAVYARMMEFSDAPQSRSIAKGHPPSAYMLRHKEYASSRETLEKALMDRLKAGTLLASGISAKEEKDDCRKVIQPSLWDILEIDYDSEEIIGPDRHYLAPQVFEPTAIPLNIREIPKWLLDALEPPELRHNQTYTDVTIGGTQFILGGFQGKVVELLHVAARSGSPWQSGKKILRDAGAETERMRDLFKSPKHREKLLESNGKGLYRLRLEKH